MRIRATLWIVLAGTSGAQQAREILDANCGTCHGAAQMGGLDLRTRESALKGGKRGPALIPGNPGESLLLKAAMRTGDLQMPPGKTALPAGSVEILRQWIANGAPFEAGKGSRQPSWWSFRKPERPAVPKVADAGPNVSPIDAFVRKKLDEKGLRPAAQASKQTLVRRAYFDLHGLPPTPAQVDEFINDGAADAWEKLIDRLLASPRYGERWGRHWLDVVRYADTGGFETDQHIRNAWRYRDYVIESFNEDKPYDEFVKEQVAADEIWGVDMELEGAYEMPKHKQKLIKRWIGTTLYAIGPMAAEYTFYGDQYRAEWQADAVEVTASAFLGLTFGCARCHDHKFDPIPQRDYYKIAAMFSGSEEKEVEIGGRMAWIEYTRHLTRELQAEELKKKALRMQGRKKPAADDDDGRVEPNRKDEYETLLRQIGLAYLRAPRRPETANVLIHTDRIPETHILTRGEWQQKGEKVEPGYPSFFDLGPPVKERERRRALAEWMTSADHPLFARVMVNRIWQGHFGQGIVGTPNDFGRQGDQPTHPELLDWLAVEFTAGGYKIKALHKQIMMSTTYRMSSAPDAANAKIDADNRTLWRMNRRRLEAEAVRDAVLAASGSLNATKMGGPAVVVPLSEEERNGMRDASQWNVTGEAEDFDRRSVYLYVKRSFRLPMFETFDSPDSVSSCARRESSTVAPQALAMMNSEFANEQAKRLAERLRRESGQSRESQIARGYRLTLGRDATAEEIKRASAFLETNSLERMCLLWFNLSEFLYVD
jgi:cytochrome c553